MNLPYHELYQLLLKKDEMILQLQEQLQAYHDTFGPLTEKTAHDSALTLEPKEEITSHCSFTVENVSDTTISTGTNVILDFVDDSPSFRRQLEELEVTLSGLRLFLKEMVQQAKELVSCGIKFGDAEISFAQESINVKYFRALFTTCLPEFGTISSFLTEFNDIFTQIQSSRTRLLLSLESLLQQTMERFNEKEIKDVAELKKELTKLGDEYENVLGKFLSKTRSVPSAPSSMESTVNSVPDSSSPKNPSSIMIHANSYSFSSPDRIPSTPNNLKSLENDVLHARMRFELARFDLVHYLNRLEMKKKLYLFESFNSALFAVLHHHRDCRDLLEKSEPSLRYRQEMLHLAKGSFAKDEIMWQRQREILRTRLEHDASGSKFDDMRPRSMSANASDMSKYGSIWSRGLHVPVQVVSSETLLNRKVMEASSICLKEGYLFVRGSGFSARAWKRKWFRIHSGKLYQNRGKHMDFVLLCDLMLSKVRECTTVPLPFCLEVLDANQTKTILQAKSEAEMMEWIVAAQKSTESMLEKQSHRMKVHPEQQMYIQSILSKNPSCADCGQAPAEWIAINIGCVLCIDCSGIHRSLGVHISKIRSLTLDSWELPLLELIRDHLGNSVVNSVWEASIPSECVKPNGNTCSREEKLKWIKAKYQFHAFSGANGLRSESAKSQFISAAESGDLIGIARGLARGVHVNTRNRLNETALQLCQRREDFYCCEFLIMNGATLGMEECKDQTLSRFDSVRIS